MADVQPVGPPPPSSGTWSLVFEDTFDGTALDTTKWTAPNGAQNSGTTMTPADVTVSGGYLNVFCSASGRAGCVDSQPSLQGWGSDPRNGTTVNVGDCVEASINFPGASGTHPYNWPAFWVSGANWPANGEEDIFESYNGTPSALNYHSNSGANNGPFPSGNWCNSFHTYTLVRGASRLDCYWDGNLVRSVTPNDNGGPQSIIILIGTGNTLQTGAASTVKVDYVRKWVPGTGGGGGGGGGGGTGAGPTLAFSDAKFATTSPSTLTSASFTPQTNDIIVVKAITDTVNADAITGNPSGGGWTYTKRVSFDPTAAFDGGYLWTAKVTAGGTAQTVSLLGPSNSIADWAMFVEVWRNGQLAASPASVNTTGASGVPSGTITTVGANSVVSWASGDWNAATGTPVYRSAATEDGRNQTNVYGAYSAYQPAAVAGAQAVGMTSPTGQAWNVVGIEIESSVVSVPSGVLGIL